MSVFISQDILLDPPIFEDGLLGHGHIGYHNIITRTNVTGTTGQAGFPVSAIANPATYERYLPVSLPATIHVDAGAPTDVNYVGIAAHSLGSNGCTVTIQSSPDNSTWTTQSSVSPTNNQSLMAMFVTTAARYWRLLISGSSAPNIGVVYMGTILQMQRNIYGGHSPITLSRVIAARPAVSEHGQWLGSTLERRGLKTSFEWRHLKADWYRENFDPFVETYPQVRPFFIAWNPLKFPDEVGYCWATGDIQPVNMGVRDYMSVNMQVEAFNDRG